MYHIPHFYYSDNKCCHAGGERGTHIYCWWQCKLLHPLWKSLWGFFRRLEIYIPYDLFIALLGILPKVSILCRLNSSVDILAHPCSFQTYNSQKFKGPFLRHSLFLVLGALSVRLSWQYSKTKESAYLQFPNGEVLSIFRCYHT